MTTSAFVTGATGYTGREVVRLLTEAGVETTAHIRPNSSSAATWEEQFRAQGATVDRTPWEEDAMADTLRRLAPDILYYLVGITAKGARKAEDNPTYESVDYGLFRLLLESASRAEIGPRVVYLSAMGVREGAKTAYYRARWKAERDLKESGLPFIIARPGMITGPDRDETRVGERLGGALADLGAAGLRVLGARRLADRYRSTDNTELACALVDLGLAEDSDNKVVEAEDLKREEAPSG